MAVQTELETAEKKFQLGALSLSAKQFAFLLACAVSLILIVIGLITGSFGEIGADSDDEIRLAQITDYLNGQSWFHTDQYRMGLAGGTDMHWSRLPDLPIILLTKVFSLFAGQEAALKIAFSVWPPMLGGLLIAAFMVGARHYSAFRGQVFTAILASLFVLTYFRFTPGNIDHHNIQFVCIAFAMGFALDPAARFKSFFFSGLALALSIAIGVDVYIFAAILCAFMAINWMIGGREAALGAQGFGLGLSGGLSAFFLLTIAPYEYRLIYCDALSLITLIAGLVGGLGLAGLAFLNGRSEKLNSLPARFAALAVLGLICILIIGMQAPQCLSNPLEALPEDAVNLWLGGIAEAKPLFSVSTAPLATALMSLGAPLVALYILIRQTLEKPNGHKWGGHCLLIALIVIALALTLYQVRFSPFAYIAALLALAQWTARHYDLKQTQSGSLGYIGCLALSIPMLWTLLALPFTNSAELDAKDALNEKQAACLSPQVIERLNALPQGLVAANANLAGNLLLKTKHRVMAGNYHRNAQGIVTHIKIAISEPEAAYELLRSSKADYLFYCESGFETAVYARHNPEGLYAGIGAGERVDYLEPVSSPQLEDGGVIIFKVKP